MATEHKRQRWYPWQVLVIALLGIAAVVALIWVVLMYLIRPEYAPMPRDAEVMNTERYETPAYDVWGRFVSADEAEELQQTDDGRQKLSPANGAIHINDELLREGREAFYRETFGNEVFLSDVVGLLEGPMTATNVLAAIQALGGKGTNNLRVELAEDVTVGGREFRRGELIDTGLDVPSGWTTILGMQIKLEDDRLRVGITCALCHAAVDPETGRIIEGAPNNNLNVGLVMALAPNSAAFFANTQIKDLKEFAREGSPTVETDDGSKPLPDVKALEEAVDSILVRWPPGQFDSTIDLVANPSKMPNNFTLGDHPYGWTGFAMAGPKLGLSMLINNVHGANADATLHADGSPMLFDIPKEVYLGTLLQNAANSRFRFDPAGGKRPSEFLESVRPGQGPGMSHALPLPTYPRPSFVSPNGLWVTKDGKPAWRQVNAIAAFTNTLRPPPAPIERDEEAVKRGRSVFEKAGCNDCHSGAFLTNNRVIPLEEIGTQPDRAPAKKALEKWLADPIGYPFNVTDPGEDKGIKVPLDHLDKDQLKLAWALGDTKGGYKVTSLVGVYWSAPYLHDGGVAVGPDAEKDLGLPGTLLRAVRPDPANSLRALIDRGIREKVVEANKKAADRLVPADRGIGHDFHIDEEAGFSRQDQDDVIHYLLTLEPPRGWKDVPTEERQ